MTFLHKAAVVALTASVPVLASAELFDRGNGLVFDSTLNITWQKNANLGATNTFGLQVESNSAYVIWRDGSMNWPGALMWIDAMNSANYLGYSDWRLPRISSAVGFNLNCPSYDGSTDCGYNVVTTRNELAHLFYVGLSNLGAFDTQGNPNPIYPLHAGFFEKLQLARYWTGTQLPPVFGPGQAFTFAVGSGLKEWDLKANPYYTTFAWAVRDGDVSAIPEPSSLALLLLGLMGTTAHIRLRSARAEA